MYKVFYNDRTVFFVDNDQNRSFENDTSIYFFTTKVTLKININTFLNNPELKKLYVVCEDIEYAFNEFIKLYKLIEAAGGLGKK